MKNLIQLHKGTITLQSREVPDLPISKSIFDPVNDTMIVVLGPSEEFNCLEVQQIFVSFIICIFFLFLKIFY